MNSKDIQLVKQEYESKYKCQCSEAMALELLELGKNDVVMVVRTIEKTEKHYKLNEFIEKNAKQKVERKERREKKETAYTEQLRFMYEQFLDDGDIDQEQYNAILAQKQGLPYNQNDYYQGIFCVQKCLYKNPIQWVHGLGLTMWDEQAFAELIPEQQEHFNIDLIRKAGNEFKQTFKPDSEITSATIQEMFGIANIAVA